VNRTAVATAALALIGVFVALAVSVVHARRPHGDEVEKSFNAAVAERARTPAAVRPRGCTKLRVTVYHCSALLRPRPAADTTVGWDLWLSGDGCWYLIPTPPYPNPSTLVLANVDLAAITGCASS
jgi:hypothetical protein